MSSKPARTILTIAMNLCIVLAILMTARLVVEFFGQLATQGWSKALVSFSNPLIVPFGISPIKTPYGGFFDVGAALMIVFFLGVDWVLSGIASRA